MRNPVLDVPLTQVIRQDIALPLQHLRVYTVGGLLLGLTACVIAAHLLVPASSQAHVAVIGGKTVGSQPREVENLFDGRLTENELGEFEETAVRPQRS